MTEKQKSNFEDDFSDDDKKKSDLKLWNYKEVTTLIGVVVSIDEEGKFGRTVVVDTENEQGLTIPSLTALEDSLKDVKVGDKLKIVNKGLIRSKTGRDYFDFDVFVKSA